MEDGRKLGIGLLIFGCSLLLFPLPDDMVMIDKSYYVHRNVYQYYNQIYGVFALTNSFSLLTGRYLEKRSGILCMILGLVIILYAGIYIRIGGSFVNSLNGGFAYDKLDYISPEMVLLQYLGVMIFALGFSGYSYSLLRERVKYHESDTQLVLNGNDVK